MLRHLFVRRYGIERRIYEIARKHCGKQSEWKISLERLQLKCGSASTLKEFRRLIGQIVEEDQLHQHIPDYSIEMDDGEMIVFRSRGTAGILPATLDDAKLGNLNAMTYELAKEACPGWDNYYLEREWLEWMTEEPRNRDARSSASAANGSSDVGRHDRNHRKMFLLNSEPYPAQECQIGASCQN